MTIRSRLTFYWAGVLAAILVVAGVAVLTLFSRLEWGTLDGRLTEEADTCANAIAQSSGAHAAALLQRLSRERDLGPRRHVRLVVGGAVAAEFGDKSAGLPVFRGAPRRGVFDGAGGRFRYAVAVFELNGKPARLEDGVDASLVRDSVARLRLSLLLIIPLLIGCIGAGYWLAGRALVPIGSLAAVLGGLSPRDLSRRLKSGSAGDEVGRLTRAINGLLERIERASLTERRFASDAAHELRTPLAALRTELEVALSRVRTPDQYRAHLDSALNETLRLCRMADQLLTLARLDEEPGVETAPLDLRAVAREAMEAVEPLAQSKALTLVSGGSGAVMVNGNRLHLQRLLINLLDNAIKFTREKGRVEVRLEPSGPSAIFTIADSGPGIPPSDLPQIFERFFRGRAHHRPGSGLGLSLCREIVRLHGGEIAARNRAEGGSEFIVTLPLAGRGAAGAANPI